jgi:DNA-binding transcriptional ArsR family regulator
MSANAISELDALNDTLSAVFSALSDPTRRAMLARLSQGEASVNELAAPFKMSLPAVSKHIKVLEKAGLLTKTINAQQRPCKIDGVQLKQAVAWIDQFSMKFTTKKIASQAVNTRATAKNSSKKQVKLEKPAKKQAKPSKPTLKPQEKTDDSDLQQQIGFDF